MSNKYKKVDKFKLFLATVVLSRLCDLHLHRSRTVFRRVHSSPICYELQHFLVTAARIWHVAQREDLPQQDPKWPSRGDWWEKKKKISWRERKKAKDNQVLNYRHHHRWSGEGWEQRTSMRRREMQRGFSRRWKKTDRCETLEVKPVSVWEMCAGFSPCVCFRCEDALHESFRWHPFHRQHGTPTLPVIARPEHTNTFVRDVLA